MVLKYALRSFAAPLLLGVFAVAPLHAADDVPATVRRVAATSALAAQEYRIGVRDGAVVAPAEVEEAKLFLTEARRAAALLPAAGGHETVAAIEGILKLVGQIASPDTIDARVRALNTLLTTTWQVTLEEMPTTPPSLARGKELYAQECSACHGALGHGDGPVARTLTPPPRRPFGACGTGRSVTARFLSSHQHRRHRHRHAGFRVAAQQR